MDPKVERYLMVLESSLRPLSVSDRAEIVTEIKSHVLTALERDPSARVDAILDALGEPEIVANRYLIERGLTPARPPIHPIVKWLVIGFLASLAMMLIFAGFLVSRFGSIVKVDDDHVRIFNGMIDIDGKQNRLSVKGFSDHAVYAGSTVISAKHAVQIDFDSGLVTLVTSADQKLSWNCSGAGGAPDPELSSSKTSFDLTAMDSVSCEIAIPASASVTIQGDSGTIALEQPRFATSAQLDSGEIVVTPSPKSFYNVDAKVESGTTASIASTTDPKALALKLRVNSGAIVSKTN